MSDKRGGEINVSMQCHVKDCTAGGRISNMCVAHAVIFAHLLAGRLSCKLFDELAAMPVERLLDVLRDYLKPRGTFINGVTPEENARMGLDAK